MEQRRIFHRVGLAYFVMFLVTVVLETLIYIGAAFFAPWLLDNGAFIWILSLVPMYLVATPLCIKVAKRTPAYELYKNNMDIGTWFRILAICLFVMYAGIIVGNLSTALISAFTPFQPTDTLNSMLSDSDLFVTFLVTVILAPIVEELLFRKICIDRVIVMGDKTAILVSGLFFGLFHGNLYQFFYAFGLGCVFAYVYIRSGKLRYTVALHMAINLLCGFLPTLFMELGELDELIARAETSMAGIGSFEIAVSHPIILILYMMLEALMIAGAIVGLVWFVKSARRWTFLSGELEQSAGKTARSMFTAVGFWLFLLGCLYLFISNMWPV